LLFYVQVSGHRHREASYAHQSSSLTRDLTGKWRYLPDQYVQGVHCSAERQLYIDRRHVQNHSGAGEGVRTGSQISRTARIHSDAFFQIMNAGCCNLNNMNESSISVSAPGKQYAALSATAVAASLASTAAPEPTDITHGTNTDCGVYYQAVTGDYCNLITQSVGSRLLNLSFSTLL